jgi:hypothetical protein
MITQEEALRIFRYDDETGKVYWKIKPCPKISEGVEAGGIQIDARTSYRRIMYENKKYLTHRIVWLMHHGEFPSGEKKFIDHIDGDGLNNKIENLRVVSYSENSKNVRKYKNNTSGFNGVSFDKYSQKYKVYIHIDGKKKVIGFYDTAEEGGLAHELASKEHFGNEYSERHGK